MSFDIGNKPGIEVAERSVEDLAIQSVVAQFFIDNNREPTAYELAAISALPEETALEQSSVVASLNQPMWGEESTTLSDIVAAQQPSTLQQTLDRELKDTLLTVVERLPKPQRTAIKVNFGFTLNSAEHVMAKYLDEEALDKLALQGLKRLRELFSSDDVQAIYEWRNNLPNF